MADRGPNEKIKKALLGAYKRPESHSVGKAELAKLPLRAAVAIAVRCVNRLRPVFRPFPDDPHREISVALIDMAIEVGELFARGEDMSGVKIADIANDAETVSRRAIPGGSVAYAAAHLAHAVRHSLAGDGVMAINDASTALAVCMQAVPLSMDEAASEMDKVLAGQMLDHGPDSIRDPLADDYAAAVDLNLGKFPDAGAPLDPGVDGPLGNLWSGEAPGWFAKR
jgi:hypothetical protein